MATAATKIKRFLLRLPLVRQIATYVRTRLARWALRVAAEGHAAPAPEGTPLEIYRLRSALHRAIGEAARERDRRLALEAAIDAERNTTQIVGS